MKTFKKLLLGAGILFNSCAMIAMDNDSWNQAPLESSISDANIDLLTSARLNNDQLNDIKALLSQAFDKKGELKSGTLSSDEQAAIDLFNAIKLNNESANSTFYENIDAIARKCVAFNKGQKALQDTLNQLNQAAKRAYSANSRKKIDPNLAERVQLPGVIKTAVMPKDFEKNKPVKDNCFTRPYCDKTITRKEEMITAATNSDNESDPVSVTQ